MRGAEAGADPGAPPEWQWDVALSFAGAQRDYVEQVAEALTAQGVRCFYDADEQIDLWGKYLVEELPAIYGEQAAAVVVFVSGEYAARDWTRLERRAALDRAVRERREFVLPARFDDTALPGLLTGMVAIDLRTRTPQQFAGMIAGKLAALGITGPAPPVDAGDPARAQNAESRAPRRDGGEYRRSALDDVADLLARAVKEQWSAAAVQRRLRQTEPIPVRWERSSKPVAGPLWAALRSQRFAPLPGLEVVGPEHLDEGGLRDLHAIYGGLGSGRLVIVGAPGSGKTGAAVLLVLAALEHREQVPGTDRPRVPVPVLLTLHGWDPETQGVEAWLARRLQRDYRLFAGEGGAAQAAELVRTGRIAVLLDGLDEIPERLRPVALDALSRLDAVRIVVLARSTEMADAVQRGQLENAVALELQDIDPLTAADYLTRIQLDPAPRAWRDLIDRLRHMPDSPIAKALNSPLTLTLVRDTYRPSESVRELLDAADRGGSPQDIEDHLLDRVLPAAYAPRPGEGPPAYQLEDAQRALRHIAVQMSQLGTRDLEWWRIPMWPQAPAPFRLIVTGLVIGPVCGFVIGLGVGLTCELGLVGGLLAGGLAGSLVFGCGCAVTGLGGQSPTQLARWRWRQLLSRSAHVVGWARWLLIGGLAFGTLAGVAVGLFVRPGLGAGIALVSWIVIGLLVGLIGGLSQPASGGSASPLTPLASWRGDRLFGLVIGLVAGLVIGLALGLALEFGAGLNSRHGLTLVIWAVVGLTLGLAVGFITAGAWPASLAFWQLARRWDTPVRLLQFLEDACKRDVLRTVGPVYQFRHSRLQDRLANPARTPVQR